MTRVRFEVLGPVAVRDAEDRPVELSGGRHRALLSLLLLDAGRVVSVDRLVDQLWGDAPPPAAQATLQAYVSQLRRLLEPERGPRAPASLLVTRGPGYSLQPGPGAVDAQRFAELVGEGARLLDTDPAAAEAALDRAVALWRGTPYGDLPDGEQVRAERARLQQLLLTAQEHRACARVRLGRADAAVADLEPLVAEHPLRERLWARLVEALYASGRQADALAAHQRCAAMLREELGIDPGPELAALHEAVLRQELAIPSPPGPRADEAVATPFRPAPPRRAEGAPLVGRRRERELLRAALARSTRGAGAVLVLEGEAGIGKTRLAEEATALAEAGGWRSAWTRCADDAGAPALWPWSRLLDQLDLGPLDAVADDDPDRSRFALFEDLRARFAEVAARTPLLLVIDDVQAADDSSLRLLTLLAGHLDQLRVLVVVTARTVGEQLAPAVQECLTALAREPRARRVQLTGLAEDDVRELLASVLGADRDEALARRVHARTEGNPFYVGELAQLLRGSDADDADVDTALPPSVRDVVERRLDALPGPTVALLRLAAVAGQEADLPLLQAASGSSAEEIVDLLDPAVAAGVLRETGAGWDWRFSHALVQETLLSGLRRVEAARLHGRIATALEARPSAEPARLAHHWLHAVPVSGTAPALRYAMLAAETARGRLAHPEAAEHARQALKLLEASPDAGSQPALRQRHALLVALGTDLLRSGQPAQAQPVVAQALEVARRLDDRALLAEAASVWGGVTMWNWRAYGVVDRELVALLEDLAADEGDTNPALRARLLGTLGVELAYSDRRDDGIRYADEAVALARRLGDVALLGRTLNNHSITTWGAERGVELRIAAADETIALAGRGMPARTEFFAHLHRGPLRLHLGDLAGFEDDLAAATGLAAGLTGPDVRSHIVYQQAGRAMLYGQWEEAEALGREAYEAYRRTAMWGGTLSWGLHRFTVERRAGRPGESLALLVELGDQGIPLLQTLAVVAAAESGDLAQARRLRARWPQRVPRNWTTDALLVARAWVALALGPGGAGADDDPAAGPGVDAAYADLLPLRGRQVVVGSATACWGSYDLVLAELALARGDHGAAAAHADDARAVGQALRSPWQVRDAEALLARSFTA